MAKLRAKTISVVIPTFNCAKKLPLCLESIKWADEIIIVDMYSTDDTLKVAKKYTKSIYQKIPQDGNFDLNRLFGMKLAKSDWVLKLDSDELLGIDLQKELQIFLQEGDDGEINGFNFYNRFFMLGKWIKHGFIKRGSHELRLIRNGTWEYDPYRYHQLIKVKGKVGFFKNKYDHYVFDTIGEFIQKSNKYTDLDSKYFSKIKKVNFPMVLAAPYKSFFKLYFFQLGFLDGTVGFVVCALFSIYNFIEKLKAWHIQKFNLI